MHDILNTTKGDFFSDGALLEKILMPYKLNCRYLQKAHVEFGRLELAKPDAGNNKNLLRAEGEFSIPSSCYIVDTGHFNSVEFNICYNQLAYYLLAECVQNKLLGNFLDWSSEEYTRR
jgi:hypothetical protein